MPLNESSKPAWMHPLMGVVFIIGGLYLLALTRNEFKAHDYIGKSEEFPHTITIVGKGEIMAIPDIATLSLGHEITRLNVADAQRENTSKMNQLHELLKGIGIPKEDITTTQYSVYPAYDWTSGRQQLRGYTLTQSVQVKVRDFSKISQALDLIGSLGLNQAGGFNFTLDDPEAFQQKARIIAMQNAQSKAEELARVAGVKLGKIVSFSESGIAPYPMPMYKTFASDAGAMAAPETPTVEPGSQKVIVNVNISYEIL